MNLLSRRTRVWLAVGAVSLLVAAANAQLLRAAWTSQPECVAHLRPGEPAAGAQRFRAAVSSCAADPAKEERR